MEGEGEHEFVGRYGGARSVTFAGEQLFLQRDGSRKLKLVMTENNLAGHARPGPGRTTELEAEREVGRGTCAAD